LALQATSEPGAPQTLIGDATLKGLQVFPDPHAVAFCGVQAMALLFEQAP
jgi:hypothetical protein